MPSIVSKISAFVFLISLPLTTSQAWAQSAYYFWGEEGDYISGGQEHYGTDAVGTFSAYSTFDNAISVGFDHNSEPGTWWDFDFAHRDGIQLTPGVYRDATRWPFNDGTHGLDISGSGRGCNTLFGHFTILSVSYGPGSSIQSLAAEFEQDCEAGDPGPWLYGWIRFNSNLPPDYNNVVEDGGFENGVFENGAFGSAEAKASGDANNWTSGTWSIWAADSHFGMYSAVTTVGGSLQQDFDPIPVEYVERISFWVKQVPASLIAVDLMYSDGTFDQFPLFEIRTVWTPIQMTEYLREEGELVGLRFYGATSSSEQITTMLDDVYVRTPFLMSDGFESADFSGWDSVVGAL